MAAAPKVDTRTVCELEIRPGRVMVSYLVSYRGKLVFATRAYPDDEAGARARLRSWLTEFGCRLVLKAAQPRAPAKKAAGEGRGRHGGGTELLPGSTLG